jgi:hypothetical protein
VLDAIDELVREGMLHSCGGDFYALTEKGKKQSRDPGSYAIPDFPGTDAPSSRQEPDKKPVETEET